ncbi:MAG: orotidine-5'-phosphate decarboxylase [Micrococcales bacterium]
MLASFGSRLEQSFNKYGQLCVGIDPHAALLDDWGLSDDVAGLETFALSVLNAAVGRVGIIKPQVSFFERHGSRGFEVLEKLAGLASQTDLLVIMDAKRGDIGTTMDGYFDAWLGEQAPFLCDALTVSPYLGFDSLKPIANEAIERGRGLFVLAATSNPEAKKLQQAKLGDATVAASIYNELGAINSVTKSGGANLGSIGAVVGATLNFASVGLHALPAERAATPILAPGFGAQGAELGDVAALFGQAAPQVIASVSRSILQAGAAGLNSAIDSATAELAAGLRG